MDDDTAHMQLVLSNNQGELSGLERGIHALDATEKGKHGRSVDAYAEEVGRAKASVHLEVCAARVAQMSTHVDISNLIDYTRHLSAIHAAPTACWASTKTSSVKLTLPVQST